MSSEIEKTRDFWAEFWDLFCLGIENIVKAAKIYVEALDEDLKSHSSKWRDLFEEKMKHVPMFVLRRLEKVGRGQLLPELFTYIGPNELKISRLPISAQQQIVQGEKFEMLTADGDILKVDVTKIEGDSARQMFARDHIRALDEQKIWLEEHKTESNETDAIQVPWKILGGGKVKFIKDAILTKPQIRNLLVEM